MKHVKLYFLTLFTAIVFAQQPKKQIAFRQLTIEQGLSQNTVISMAQDSTGYLWFATQDGINRYNGRSFKYYNEQFENVTRPKFSRLGKIYIDRQNRFWIITNLGHLKLYNKKADNFTAVKTNYSICSVFQDTDTNLYLGTYNQGLYKIVGKSKDTIQIFNSSDKNCIVYDFLEHDNQVFTTTSQGVFKVNNDNSYSKVKTEIPKGIHVSNIVVSKTNTIWLGTYGKGLYYKTKNSTIFKKFKGVKDNKLPNALNIEDILIDRNNKLWVATYGDGVYIIDLKNEEIEQFKSQKNNPFAVHYNDILCLYEDKTGTVWLGTDGAGASYYDEHVVKFNLFTNRQLPYNVNVDVIRSVTTDSLNNIWLGTSGHGLTYIDLQGEEHKTLTTKNSKLNSNRIVSLCYFNQDLWIGHQDTGLNILDSKGAIHSFTELSNQTIWKILINDTNQVWICTENNGLILFDKNLGVLKQFNTSNSNLQSNNIRTVIWGDNNTLWIGTTDNGLYTLNLKNNAITKVNEVEDDIKSLYLKDNTLWIGTNGNGLKQLNIATKKVTTFNAAHGLPNNVIYGILPDSNNKLWLSTNYGLSEFWIDKNGKPNTKNYTNKNGLQGLEFNTGAYYKDNNGVLYFGGLEGVNWFVPQQLSTNTIKPRTVITDVALFSKPINFNTKSEFNYDENTITFTFSGLHFSQPEGNMYKYRLVNNDKDWIDAGNKNTAHYTNLPPKNYEFQVISSNYDGVWNTTPEVYRFTINKPWYKTNTAIGIYGLLFLLGVYRLYSYLNWRFKIKTQLQLEHAETERLKKLDEFKTKLYTNISHEIRTPLTLITGPIDLQLNRDNVTQADKQQLNIIRRNANRLLYLANQMLDLSLVDSGQLKLKVSKEDPYTTVLQIVESFKYKAQEKNITIHDSISTVNGEAWIDIDVLEKILTNLISNAIKYSPIESDVFVNLMYQDNAMILSVINVNNNLNHKDFDRLFNRFYQNNEASDGMGVGLALVKELVELSKGTVLVNSIDADKIQFTVTLPVDRASYNDNEIIEIYKEENLQLNTLEEKLTELDKKYTILIIEDETDIRNFIASIFTKDYTIYTAENGKIGIDLALKHQPDLIVSDIMMPVLNGIEVCNTLKHNKLTSHVPIILLTAKVGAENEIEGLKTGADAYVTKPFNVEKLKVQVDRLINIRDQLKDKYKEEFSITSDLEVTSTETEFLKQLQQVINTHISDTELTSESFARHMLMSRMQLHRKLKSVLGLTTSEFIRSQRLKLAKQMLDKTQYTVSEIAFKAGFNSPSYFIKCFKEAFNTTPSQYLEARKA